MKKKSQKNRVKLFALKVDAYTFEAGQIFELIEENVDLPFLRDKWVVVSNEDFHPVDFSQYQFRQTFYIQKWLLEPIGYI